MSRRISLTLLAVCLLLAQACGDSASTASTPVDVPALPGSPTLAADLPPVPDLDPVSVEYLKLVIACPHALGLAIPLVNMNATSMSARNGILVRNREAFERGRNIAFVAFDKTGTLTEGRFGVTHVVTAGMDDRHVLAMVAGLERASEHPLAAAIFAAANEAGGAPASATAVTAAPGYGVEGTIEGRLFRVGRPEWATELGITTGHELRETLAAADRRGESAVVLMDEHQALAVITLADRIRGGAKATIAELRAMGITPVMVTGDAEAVAATVAAELGIDRYYARVLPQDKARIVADLQQEGPTGEVERLIDIPALT